MIKKSSDILKNLPEGASISDGGLVSIGIPYHPRPHQLLIHNALERFKVAVCHRRLGKSVMAVNEIIKRAMECTRDNPQYAYISPTAKQSKRNVWNLVKYYSKFIPYTKFNEAELKVTFPNGAQIYLLGAENYNDIRGMYLDGVVLDEVANLPEEMWTSVIRPALSDRLGWGLFVGTPSGENAFYRLYRNAEKRSDWFRILVPVTETNYLAQSELDAALDEMGPDLYAQEYLCSWTAALKGSYYSHILSQLDADGRIDEASWDPSLPVTTSWDLGLKDKTCIWFAQTKGSNVYLIDYYEGEDKFLPDYAKVVLEKPYLYKEHLLPHDSIQTRVDQPNSSLKQLRDLGLKCTMVPKTRIIDGINLVRTLLPRCYFNREKCELGLQALLHYRTEYDSIKGVYKETPVHNFASHASDAFRYLAIGLKSETQKAKPQFVNKAKYDPFITNVIESSYDPFNFHSLGL